MGNTLEGFPDFFQYAVNALTAACPGSSIGSGSRTNEEQASLYAAKGPWSPTNPGAAAPGTSNHEVGVGAGAADMEGNLECLHAKAAAFGLTFPMDNEPWHIEPTDELIQQGMEFFGQTGEEPEADSLDAIRQIVFGGTQNPAQPEIPDRVAQAYAEEKTKEAEFVPTASAGFDAGAEGALSDVDAARYFAQAGFSGEALVTMVATAIGESGLNPGATGDTSLTDGTWGPSLGLAQIRSLNDQRGTGGWRDASQLTDPAFNARAAWAISNGGTNFSPWTIWKTGAYKENLDRAKKAVGALGSDAYGPAGSTAVGGGTQDDDEFAIDLDLFDPAGIAQEIAADLLNKPKTDPTERLKTKEVM